MKKIAALFAAGLTVLHATATTVQAQRLMEKDGIELRGVARVVQYAAASCNVSETAETAASYEQKKASEGQPIDIWQLEFSVYNGSGKALDHLVANYQIAAENLPCTSWDMSAAMDYPAPVQWGGAASFIQRSSDRTAPGETLTTSSYVWVFHEHQPRFDTWSFDYTFAASPSTQPAAPETRPAPVASPMGRAETESTTDRPQPPVPPAVDPPVPPAVDLEICTDHNGGSALCWIEVSSGPPCYLLNYEPRPGETATWSGECSGEYADGPGTVTRIVTGGDTWTARGTLVGGRKEGQWNWELGSITAQVSFKRGLRHGEWILRDADDGWVTQQGQFVDGQATGEWTYYGSGGSIREQGLRVNGPRHGEWTYYYPDGKVFSEGPYVNGHRHGEWTFYPESYIIDSNRPFNTFVKSKVLGGQYVEGIKQGEWVEYRFLGQNDDGLPGLLGDLREGTYLDGKRHETWTFYNRILGTTQISFKNGVAAGGLIEWLYGIDSPPTMWVSQVPLVNGKRHGRELSCSYDEDGYLRAYASIYINDESTGNADHNIEDDPAVRAECVALLRRQVPFILARTP